MSTSVTDAWKGVIFRHESQTTAPGAKGGMQGSVKADVVLFDLEETCTSSRGIVLLPGQFRMGMQPFRQFDEGRQLCINGAVDPALNLIHLRELHNWGTWKG